MSLTESSMLALGRSAPNFSLPDVVTGEAVSLETFAGKKGLLVMFICAHCPYVIHVQGELARLGRDYGDSDLGIVAVSANDVTTHPADAPDRLREMARRLGFQFPYCYDESQQTARAYSAACTPDFFLFGEDRALVYRGQLDDSRPDNGIGLTGKDLRSAIDAVLEGREVSREQKPSIGCNIKWRPGNEPTW